MKKRFGTYQAIICCFVMAAASGIARGQDNAPEASKKIVGIAAGTDFLQTATGTQAEIMKTVVPLTGVPIKGEGSVDTIVQRTQDAGQVSFEGPDFTATIPITLQALNMTGTLGACTVSITLAASPASTGTMTITTTSATGGTFSSTLSVYYIAMFTPAATCPQTTKGHYTFSQKGSHWSTTPGPNAYIVSGPYGNPNVNQHTGLPPGIVDFYITGTGTEANRTSQHVVCAAFAAAGVACPTT
jgi:hypothetical protein